MFRRVTSSTLILVLFLQVLLSLLFMCPLILVLCRCLGASYFSLFAGGVLEHPGFTQWREPLVPLSSIGGVQSLLWSSIATSPSFKILFHYSCQKKPIPSRPGIEDWGIGGCTDIILNSEFRKTQSSVERRAWRVVSGGALKVRVTECVVSTRKHEFSNAVRQTPGWACSGGVFATIV